MLDKFKNTDPFENRQQDIYMQRVFQESQNISNIFESHNRTIQEEQAAKGKKIEVNLPINKTKGAKLIQELEAKNKSINENTMKYAYETISTIVLESLWLDTDAKRQNLRELKEHIEEHVQAFAEHGMINLNAPVPALKTILEDAKKEAESTQVLFFENDAIAKALVENISSQVKTKVKDIITKEQEIAQSNRDDIEEIQQAAQSSEMPEGDMSEPMQESVETQFLRLRQHKKLQESQTIYRAATQYFSQNMELTNEANAFNDVMANSLIMVTMLETFNTMGILSMTPIQYAEFKQRLIMA